MTRPSVSTLASRGSGRATGERMALPELPVFLVAYRREVIVALHLLLIPAVYLLAFLVRFDLAVPESYFRAFLQTLPVLLVVRMVAFRIFRLYSGWWRHIGMFDLVALVRAATASSLVFVALLFLLDRDLDLPRSILILDWAFTILVLGGIRFGVRWAREDGVTDAWSRGGKRTLIVGADDAAARILREARIDPSSGLHPVGIVDDDPRKRNYQLHGVSVLGTTDELRTLLEAHRIEMLIIASPTVSREQMRRFIEQCAGLTVELKIAPPLGELVDGRARLNQLRTVDIEDLLGRDAVHMDLRVVEEKLRGRTVLVTGGAGSIGSELARQAAGLGISRLVLVEKAESPLYFVDLELRRAHPALEIVPVIADVTNRARFSDICDQYRPDTIFHAAAYKHVPLMEGNVVEAVRNNVLGTLVAAEVAVECGARRFVLISTDKAVRPSSVMGATKRIAERLILGLPQFRDAATDFRAVRFGNVLGSDGSVVPLFKRQIAAGGPVTVTHPDVTRYFMTIPEAVQLVLQAATLPEAAGSISMLDMGEPMRIVELAENLIRLSGLEPYTEMPIVFTGLRPGEKLFEELQYDVEQAIPTAVDKICIVQGGEDDADEVRAGLDFLMDSLTTGTTGDLLAMVRVLVPECVTPLRDAAPVSVTTPTPPLRLSLSPRMPALASA
jgi:FlaA1/EpsC-like NDP-sugar epimerase